MAGCAGGFRAGREARRGRAAAALGPADYRSANATM